jgi:hypothetical protein
VSPIDPNKVTMAELGYHVSFLEDHYQKYCQVEGIIWQTRRSDPMLEHPDRYGSGGDSCIFTGHKLAADVFRYKVTGEQEDLDRVFQSLRGLYILSHITGTPGVLCRAAFPAADAEKWGYPESWSGRNQDFIHTSPADIEDPFNPGQTFPEMVYYTRATKDQLTGVLFGLAVAWKHLDGNTAQEQQAKAIIAVMTQNIYDHLRLHDFDIRDENGANETNADHVDELMLQQLLALYKETVYITRPSRASRIYDKYKDNFDSSFFTAGDLFHRWNNYQQYYAWNLRYLRGYTVWLLENSSKRQDKIKVWFEDRLWQFTKGHLNTKFIFFFNIVLGKTKRLDEAVYALKSLKLKPLRSYGSPLAGDERKPSVFQVLVGDWDRFVLPPHLRKPTSYSTWQKEPWDVGHSGDGSEDATGLDFILPYWMGRYYGFLSEN